MDRTRKILALVIVLLSATVGWEGYVLATSSPSVSRVVTPGAVGPCTWFVSMDGTTPVAMAMVGGLSVSPGDNVVGTAGQDISAFVGTFLVTSQFICFSAATFTLASTLNELSGDSFLGSGSGTVIKQAASANLASLIKMPSTTHEASISGFRFDGNGASQTSPSWAVEIDGYNNTADNIWASNFYSTSANPSAALVIKGGHDNVVQRVSGSGLDGAGTAYGAYRNIIKDSVSVDATTHAFSISGGNGYTWGNLIDSVSVYNSQGIGVSMDGDSEYNTISHVYVNGSIGDAANFEQWSAPVNKAPRNSRLSDITITNGRIAIAGTSALYVMNVTVSNFNVKPHTGEAPIYLFYGKGVTIENGNTYLGTDIHVENSNGVVLANIYSWKSGNAGVSVTSSQNVTITNVQAKNSWYAGLEIDSSAYVSISTSYFSFAGQSGSYQYGVRILGSTYVTLSSSFANSNQIGVQEVGASNFNTIIGVTAVLNSLAGITKVGASTHVDYSWNNTSWIA